MNEEGPAPAAAPAKRPWWVPLLGVGTMGLGGVQGLGGMGILLAGMQLKGPGAATFLLASAAWLLPGALLVAAGIGIVIGARWARGLSLAAVAAGAAGVGAVALRRERIPPAVADLVEFASSQGGVQKQLSEALANLRKGPTGDPVAILRDPAQAPVQGAIYTGYCCCPALPWQILLLLVCATPLGRRIAAAPPSSR